MRIRHYVRPAFLAGLLSIASIALAADAPAPADSATAPTAGPHMGHGGPGAELHHVLAQLNLTADQKNQVHAILAGAKPQFESLHTSSRANQDAMLRMKPDDPGYPAAVAAAKENSAARIQLASDLKTQVYAVLTPEQQAQIPAIQDAMKAKRAARKSAWKAEHTDTGYPSAVR